MTRKDAQRPRAKGWCPGAYRPMMSGDGLVVRVRPFRSTLAPAQVQALCGLARRFGNGTVDLTTRANLQIRGITEADYPSVLQELAVLDLLDDDASVESRRNILMAPDWQAGGLSDRLHGMLLDILPGLPPLPQKMGFALDTGAHAQFAAGSADFRFERDTHGHLLLRADGAACGRRIDETGAMAALADMVEWFIKTGGPDAGRMARHLRATRLPEAWQEVAPRTPARALKPGATKEGMILGVPFGNMAADALEGLIVTPGATELRLMPGRLIWLRGTSLLAAPEFVASPDNDLLTAHACPGAPFCPQASVETRALARRLASEVPGTLHVSGCAKGCALPRAADVTLTGRDGRFDLVRNGAPWDEPAESGLVPECLHDLTGLA